MCLLRGTDWNFTIQLTNPTPYIDRTVAQAVSRWPLPTEAHFRLQARPSEICGGQSGTETGFFLVYSRFPCQYHSITLLTRWKKGNTWESSKQ